MDNLRPRHHPPYFYQQSDSSHVLGDDSLKDFLESKFKSGLLLQGVTIFRENFSLSSSIKKIHEFLKNYPEITYSGAKYDEYGFSDKIWIDLTSNDGMIDIEVYGEETSVRDFVGKLQESFDVAKIYVRWIYDPQYLESMNVPVSSKNLPFTEMYSFLNGETLEDFYDRFMASDASILLLIGPPGTGKSTFIRGFMHHTEQNAILTYNEKLLESDSFFAEWFRSTKESVVIMEDADTLILPRSDGNSMMQRFLNLGDGLLSLKNKKMIFSTNLPSTANIDSALLRPGRTFDVLNFSPLTVAQAEAVVAKTGVDFTPTKPVTIAEIFADNKVRKPSKTSSFGFI